MGNEETVTQQKPPERGFLRNRGLAAYAQRPSTEKPGRRRRPKSRPSRSLSVRGDCARRGSRAAPQIAHPAANALTRAPHCGQACGLRLIRRQSMPTTVQAASQYRFGLASDGQIVRFAGAFPEIGFSTGTRPAGFEPATRGLEERRGGLGLSRPVWGIGLVQRCHSHQRRWHLALSRLILLPICCPGVAHAAHSLAVPTRTEFPSLEELESQWPADVFNAARARREAWGDLSDSGIYRRVRREREKRERPRRTCEACDAPLPEDATGRRRFCDTACRVRHHRRSRD